MAVSSRKLLCWAIAGTIMLTIGIVLATVGDIFILTVMEKVGISLKEKSGPGLTYLSH